MDIIFLHDLRIETVIGIWEWERKIRQTVVIDLEMSADIARAAATAVPVNLVARYAIAGRITAADGLAGRTNRPQGSPPSCKGPSAACPRASTRNSRAYRYRRVAAGVG